MNYASPTSKPERRDVKREAVQATEPEVLHQSYKSEKFWTTTAYTDNLLYPGFMIGSQLSSCSAD